MPTEPSVSASPESTPTDESAHPKASASFAQLVQSLLQRAPFADADDAEQGLVTTLEVLGYVLPARLVDQLAAHLPSECGSPLMLGLATSRVGKHKATPGLLPPDVLERVQETGAALANVLPTELLGDIERELPAQLLSMFERVHVGLARPAR